MTTEILARLQFAVTIMFHYIYPPLSIGLGLILVIMEATYLKTGLPVYKDMAKFWTKIFALTFALGVATGIVMEFEFGTNWSTYSRYVGDVFGSALAAEGIFAFFLESGFLAILLFGWERVRPATHFFATVMVCLGAHFSAIWIVVANSWMQTPAGFRIVGEGINARAQIIDFWAMVFNPSSMDRLGHVILGAWLAGAFMVISVSAYYLLRNKHKEFARNSIKTGLIVAMVAIVLQAVSGDSSARGVAHNQPAKFASLEGIYRTQNEAPLSLFGIPNSKEGKVDYKIGIPKLLSWITFGDTSATIKGLDQYPREDWPNVSVVFQTYHLMIAMWTVMLITVVIAIIKWRKQTLFQSKWMLWALVISVLYPQVANQVGWMTAEMGRYPWIVQDHLRISEGLSKVVTANQIIGSLIMFSIVYFMLFILFIYLLNEKIKHGPDEFPVRDFSYPHQYIVMKEATNDSTTT